MRASLNLYPVDGIGVEKYELHFGANSPHHHI
jgi:hypothetical protein